MNLSNCKNIISALIAITILFLAGCTPLIRLKSGLHYKTGLLSIETDSRILFEDGSKENAMKIAVVLDSAVQVVEGFFQSPFSKPIYITVCATQKNYVRRCGAPAVTRGMSNWGRVFLSPLSFSSNTYESILIHELAHLHTMQKIGTVKYVSNIPTWFSEGISVYVSDGGGAEKYSDSAAIDFISKGKHIIPLDKGSLFRTGGATEKLHWNMYYKQSEVFVKYLISKDYISFTELMTDLEDGLNFRKAFVKHNAMPPSELFNEFVKSISQDDGK